MGPVTLLATLLALGVEVRADGDHVRYRPGHAVPRELRDAIVREKPELLKLLADEGAQVAWRAERMRQQVPPTSSIPLLVAQDVSGDLSSRCRSCGDRLPPDARFRCRPCVLAATEVLRIVGPGESHRLLRGDSRDILPTLPADGVQLVATSPPFNVGWDYPDLSEAS